MGTITTVLDLSVLEQLRATEPAELRDAGHLEHDLLPRLGFYAGRPEFFPAHLRHAVGRGVQAWQWPNQLGPYLAEVARHDVRTYLEVGVFRGGTFVITVELLRRLGTLRTAAAVDLLRLPAIHRYAAEAPEVVVRRYDTRDPRFARFVEGLRPDFALVDGDHSEEGCQRDLDVVRPHARLIALHDISEANHPGVRAVWDRLRREHAGEYDFHEFTAQYEGIAGTPPHMGFGLAVRRGYQT